MEEEFNNLSKKEQRNFIIEKILSDDFFKDFDDEFKEKFKIKKELEFIYEYKEYFAEYKNAINNCYIEQSRYNDLYLDLFSARRSIDISSQNPNVMKKDNDGKHL